MAGQAPSRRQMLQAITCATLASTSNSFFRWSYAFAELPSETHAGHGPVRAPARRNAYKPVFFSLPEYRAIVALAELILPATASPLPLHPAHGRTHSRSERRPEDAGATDAGVAEFIDFMASADPTLQQPFRDGLRWMDAASAPGANFLAQPHAAQTAVLERVAYKRNFRPEDKAGQDFFVLLRRYTVIGFYSSRVGLEAIDYPGLRFYGSSPAVMEPGVAHPGGTGEGPRA